MARILVTADPRNRRDAPVVLDERVLSIHLSDGHAADQLIERLGWAISDAEELERSGNRRTHGSGRRARGSRQDSPGYDRIGRHS
jgi:hypothetical protein